MDKVKELTDAKVEENGQVEDKMSLEDELEGIKAQYTEASQKSNQYKDLSIRCLGAIEILEKLIADKSK